MRRTVVIAIAAGSAFAVTAELVSDTGLGSSLADLATGLTIFGCGVWGARQRPNEVRWLLLACAGLAWFLGNFASAGSPLLSSIGAALIYLHRGALVHASVTGRRVRLGALAAATATAGYAAALITNTSVNSALTLASAVLTAAVALSILVHRGLRRPRHELLLTVSQLTLAAALALAGLTALADVTGNAAQAALYGYEAGLGISALLLTAALGSELRARATLADLVVLELGQAWRPQTLRGALARALRDESLQVGYWAPDFGRYVDADGFTVTLPGIDDARTAILVERDGEPLATLVHDAVVLDDPSLVEAVREASALLLTNSRLEAAVATQLAELRASRRRIVHARDDQRRRLSRLLHEGAERRLGEVGASVERARAQVAPGLRDLSLLDVLTSELAQAREELGALARGIHPRALTESGLGAALSVLVDRAPVAIELVTPTDRLPAPIEAAAYFICAEAVTNVAKYASASRVRCEVIRSARLVSVAVIDDGVGGADPRSGSGLRGLADRIDALGGTFSVTSPAGRGTIIRAELPLEGW
jgi:signal transduction histidine kinase